MSAQLYYLSSHQCHENCASKTTTCLGLPNLCQEQPLSCFDEVLNKSFESGIASEGSFEMPDEPKQFTSIPMARASVAFSRSALKARIEAAKDRYLNSSSLAITRPLLN